MPTYDEVPRTSWILRYSAQATVVVSRTFFTQEVSEAFDELEEGNEDALKVEYERQVRGRREQGGAQRVGRSCIVWVPRGRRLLVPGCCLDGVACLAVLQSCSHAAGPPPRAAAHHRHHHH